MKKIFKTLLVCFLAIGLTNCEDNEKSPLAEQVNGAYVLIDVETQVIDVTAIETSTYGGTLRAPVGNVASHEFEVRRVSDGVASEFVPIYSTTTFPAEFKISAGDIAAALGLDVADLLPGDRFDFVGKTTKTDGSVVYESNLNADLLAESGQRQAYRLQTFISCPFSVEEAVGTYEVIQCDLGGRCTSHVFEMVAGDEPNTVVMIDPYNSDDPDTGDLFRIEIQVNPVTGQITIESQEAFDTGDYCCAGYSPTSVSTEVGFFFSCVGVLTTTMSTSLERLSDGARFTFGPRAFVAQKL